MPKEFIYDETRMLPGPDETESRPSPLAVTVMWGIDTSVQLGTVHTEKEQFSPESGWFIDMSREQINRLIKVLRKARDQAFGVDE